MNAKEALKRRPVETRLKLIEALRWLSLGMGFANTKFARRLSSEVGFRAFVGPSEDGFFALEGMLAGINPGKHLADILQVTVKPGEKMAQAIIRSLSEEAESSWLITEATSDSKRLQILADRISKDAAELESWAKRMTT